MANDENIVSSTCLLIFPIIIILIPPNYDLEQCLMVVFFTEATSELIVENSESVVKETTIIPESPNNEDIVAKESAMEPNCSVGSEACSETATKQKTPPSKVPYKCMYKIHISGPFE